ncbi:hypothetical protein SUVZ_12G2580 [Saccharomyces uvarum]|uniref:Meiotic sister-chromatid recombination protein 3 n=1 Tax=Saccharomyces uvarum TaxID=230603 RepID=A0ABN8WLV8_SACUV|nr:hypothetical protein SUVZ_12G2580 [Saccharomyces uvarum]
MVFGFAKRDRRVPDLSRYDYYYQNQEDYNKSPQLSAAAASAASAALPDQANYSRSHSLAAHAPPISKQRNSVKAPGRRLSTSSAAPPSSRGTAKPHPQKTYSLRSQRSEDYHLQRPNHANNGSRMNSMTSGANVRRNRGGKNKSPGGNSDSRANSITVKTTQVTDPSGRTQSITKKTIKKINGYEYVETTTTTKNLVPLGDSQRHFDEFSGNYMLQDDDIVEEQNADNIHDIMEENETENDNPYSPVNENRLQDESELNLEKPDFPPGSYFHHKYSTDIMPLEEESSLSNFSDALDYIPPTGQPNNKYIHKKRKPTLTTRRQKQPVVTNAEPKVKKPLTEAEMYVKALEVAKRNVYHTDVPSNNAPTPIGSTKQRKSRMGEKMTLRGGSDAPATAAKSNTEAQSKRFTTTLLHRNDKSEPNEGRNHSLMSYSKSEQPVESLSESKYANTGLTDEQMYAQALKIAQARYYNSHGIQPETINSTDNSNAAVNPAQDSVDYSVPPENVVSNKQTYTREPQIPVQSEVHEYETVPLQKTKTGGSSKNKFKSMFGKVLQFSQENYGYQNKKDQGQQAPVDDTAEESFPAASPMDGVRTSRSYSNIGMATSLTADSLEPHQQQTESALSSLNGLSQSNINPQVASVTTRTKTLEQQETVRSSSSLLQDQTPQRQENATDPTTATTTTTTTVTNEMSIAEPPTSLAIPAETPVVSQPTIVTATNTTKTVQAQAPPTKHKKSSFFTKLFKKKSRR